MIYFHVEFECDSCGAKSVRKRVQLNVSYTLTLSTPSPPRGWAQVRTGQTVGLVCGSCNPVKPKRRKKASKKRR